MRIDFYHLTAAPLAKVLPRIAERVAGAGDRLLIVAGDEGLLASLDEALWTYAPESFLPHGRDGERAKEQLILLSDKAHTANGAKQIALVDGIWRDEALAFERTFYFFEAGQVEAARAAWRKLGESGEAERHYWKQDDGGKWVEGP